VTVEPPTTTRGTHRLSVVAIITVQCTYGMTVISYLFNQLYINNPKKRLDYCCENQKMTFADRPIM